MKFREYKKNLKKEYDDQFVNIETSKVKKIHSKSFFENFKLYFKVRYVFYGLVTIFLLVLLIEHFVTMGYNESIKKYNAEVVEHNNGIKYEYKTSTGMQIAVKNEEQYNSLISTKTYRTIKEKRKSILSNLFDIRCTSSGKELNKKDDFDASNDIVAAPGQAQPGQSATEGGNQFDTNVQIAGIDEADVAKCDGKYIYVCTGLNLVVYDLDGNCIAKAMDQGTELFLYENKIITFEIVKGGSAFVIYEFNDEKLTKVHEIQTGTYMTSRLAFNQLFIISNENVEQVNYDCCYYDGYSIFSKIATIRKINLDTLEEKEVQSFSSSDLDVYVSNNNIYLASSQSCIMSVENFVGNFYSQRFTSISVFDYDLNPKGTMSVAGVILNQFSMDEYDGYFRVVSTNTLTDPSRYNSLTIFDIQNEIKEVSFLNEGIGLYRQTVRSVRFDKTTCYVVTYANSDPLYEIDCSNPQKPVIVSAYEAPGYSNYLHNFIIDDKEYLLGLGYLSNSWNETKISLYVNNEETTQIGNDFVLSFNKIYYNEMTHLQMNTDYYSKNYLPTMFQNHKALFIYNDGKCLYLGALVASDAYVLFEIDPSDELSPIKIKQEYKSEFSNYKNARAFLIDGKLYITGLENLIISKWNN